MKHSLILLAVIAVSSCGDKQSTVTNIDQNSRASSSPQSASPSETPSPVPVRTPDRTKYDRVKGSFFGLYYVSSKDGSDDRGLVISADGKEIPEKANDPEAATIPGFYLSRDKRFDFEEIEIVGKNIYFKTRESDGIYFEFRGVFGEEIEPNIEQLVPFLDGKLRRVENGKLLIDETVRFGHAIIA